MDFVVGAAPSLHNVHVHCTCTHLHHGRRKISGPSFQPVGIESISL